MVIDGETGLLLMISGLTEALVLSPIKLSRISLLKAVLENCTLLKKDENGDYFEQN